MSERLTWDEICKRYPNQRVGLDGIQYEDNGDVKSAIVRYCNLPYETILEYQVLKGGCKIFDTSDINYPALEVLSCQKD